MKAFLLAGGLGTRLRPLTDTIPKCLLEIDGQPLLDIWLDALAEAGIDEVLVNLHHLPDVVSRHVSSRPSAPAVRLAFEPELLGSAGTLLASRAWVEGEEMFLACNADNLTDFDVRSLIDTHRGGGADATLAVFHAENPSACGIVDVGADGVVTAFVEKPREPVSDLANAGMYAFSPAVLDLLGPFASTRPLDIGYHLLPQLVGRARVVAVDGYFLDIGTNDAYRRAQLEWRPRSLR